MKTKLVLTSTLLILSSQAFAANIVVNGSFEAPFVTPGTYETFPGNTAPGWTASDGGLEIRNNLVGTAYDGNQFAELDSTENSSISQTLNTIADQWYKVSYAYSPRIDQPSSTNGIQAFWNGVSLGNLTGQGDSENNWVLYTFNVLGLGDDVLKFMANGTSDSFGGNIDGVSVSAVPVPAALLMFAPALLGFMGLRHRAKSKAIVA